SVLALELVLAPSFELVLIPVVFSTIYSSSSFRNGLPVLTLLPFQS
ncbi:hypothetical protein A2U01_0083733, partial [Trifolium medium]|nr:hypothetical protein [Trifolium medium]